MNNKIKGKKALLICPQFFNYHKEIIKTIEELGCSVTYFDERPSNSFMDKALIRINEKFLQHKINRHYNEILDEINKTTYDYILIIKPEAISADIIKKMKFSSRNSKIILYLWDSIENYKNVKSKIKYADEVYSFDRDECNKYAMKFRPLFYIDKYCNIKEIKEEYDLLFVGTVHSDRYKVIKEIKEHVEKKGYKVHMHMYLQNKFLYLIKRFLLREFNGSRIEEFHFKSLSQSEIIELVQKSKVILDINHPNQQGLTMRTIEMIGANKKLITTNEDIKKYDFYDENNILVINRENIELNEDIFVSKYRLIDNTTKEKYSLKSWVKEILA